MPLTRDEEMRYSRHLILPQVGLAGQERLRRSCVTLVGAGGLGSPCALYLAAAGVGTLTVIDNDVVEVTNLQRQVMHRAADVGRPKVDSAADAVRALNPLTRVIPRRARLTADNARALLADTEVVIDGTDNFPTRYLLNDACALLGLPLVFGSIYRFEGQATVFDARRGPCYRCLFPTPPAQVPSCAEGGVLGVLPGIIGALQATETLKLILGIGELLLGRLLCLDALTMRWREIRFSKDGNCPVCGVTPTITELTDLALSCDAGPRDQGEHQLTTAGLRAQLATRTPVLVDVREPWECEELPGLPGALAIPFSAFTARMAELDSADDLVLYCLTGARSTQAVALLRQAGFTRAASLAGGLLAFRSEHEEG